MGVDISDIVRGSECSLGDLKGRKIAIDGYNTLYQFLSSIRQPDGTPLKDSKGRITSHLSGALTRTAAFFGIVMLAMYYLATPPWPGLVYTIPAEGSYLIINKTLIELCALFVTLLFSTGHIVGLDRLFRLARARARGTAQEQPGRKRRLAEQPPPERQARGQHANRHPNRGHLADRMVRQEPGPEAAHRVADEQVAGEARPDAAGGDQIGQ